MKIRSVMRNASFVAVTAAVFALSGCDEELGLCGLTEEDLGMGDVFVETTSYFLNVVGRVDEALRNEDLQNNGTATIDNATVTLVDSTLTIDFGSSNVTTADGRNRRGQLVGNVTGDYFLANSSISLQMINYHVDDVPITGSIVVSNDGPNGNGLWEQSLNTMNFAVDTLYDYGTSLVMQWLDGYATTDSIEDDIFTLAGNASGDDNVSGASFTTNFIHPMKYDRSCTYKIVEGEVDLVLTGAAEGLASINVDFITSDGCNNVLIVEAECDETTISFPKAFDGF